LCGVSVQLENEISLKRTGGARRQVRPWTSGFTLMDLPAAIIEVHRLERYSCADGDVEVLSSHNRIGDRCPVGSEFELIDMLRG
jgi:hypothetical protein